MFHTGGCSTWFKIIESDLSLRVRNKNNFLISQPKHVYVVGTQKNRLNKTVLLSIHNICLKLWARKKLQYYADFFFVCLKLR